MWLEYLSYNDYFFSLPSGPAQLTLTSEKIIASDAELGTYTYYGTLSFYSEVISDYVVFDVEWSLIRMNK